jgi:hypothetical protein
LDRAFRLVAASRTGIPLAIGVELRFGEPLVVTPPARSRRCVVEAPRREAHRELVEPVGVEPLQEVELELGVHEVPVLHHLADELGRVGHPVLAVLGGDRQLRVTAEAQLDAVVGVEKDGPRGARAQHDERERRPHPRYESAALRRATDHAEPPPAPVDEPRH